MTAPASPAPSDRAAPSGLPGQLVAALALLLVAPPALAGWLAGAVVVRSGWVPRRRLAAAAGVTGALALLVIGPRVVADGLVSAVRALGQLPIPSEPSWAVLGTLAALLWRGLGVAAVTVPAGMLAAVFDSNPGTWTVT